MSQPLARIIDQLKREPSRTGSIAITMFGDAIVPRGGSVALGTLLEFFAAIDVDSTVVRTAMSRLTADGWFVREKVGRNSFYRLVQRERLTFDIATKHIYGAPASELELEGEIKIKPAAERPGFAGYQFGQVPDDDDQQESSATEQPVEDMPATDAQGKASFDHDALVANFLAVLDEIQRVKPASAKGRYLKSISVSSTMGPGVKVDPTATRLEEPVSTASE